MYETCLACLEHGAALLRSPSHRLQHIRPQPLGRLSLVGASAPGREAVDGPKRSTSFVGLAFPQVGVIEGIQDRETVWIFVEYQRDR